MKIEVLFFLFGLIKSFTLNKINYKINTIIKMSDTNDVLFKFGSNPRLEAPNDAGELTWYPIGFPNEFKRSKPTPIIIRDINYIVWKDRDKYYSLRDACSHQGASFYNGCINKNTITCPYHGYTFNGDGELTDIPKLQFIDSEMHNIHSFKVVEKNGLVFMNTIPIKNNESELLDLNKIWVEPEAFDTNQKPVYLTKNFEHNAKFVSVNSLDICHIGFVHTFGNNKNPNPINTTKVFNVNDSPFHYKIIYEYLAGPKSLVNKIYKYDKITVENEYILPHTTVARVIFGNFSSTIITQALPISKFKTKLFVKAYRNYWYFDINKTPLFLRPLNNLVNLFGDLLTENTMETTLSQDKAIVDYIDKIDYKTMHGKFSILYDMMSNHYKNKYKQFYENNKNSF
jgi:phenylpropionate dioxygenase-like ring-hydroxylating dioxygenase large terminal subunit